MRDAERIQTDLQPGEGDLESGQNKTWRVPERRPLGISPQLLDLLVRAARPFRSPV